MSISTVITLGYGSFAGVQYVPTLGYSTGGTPTPTLPKGVKLYRTYEKKKLETLERYFDQPLLPLAETSIKVRANGSVAAALLMRRRLYF